MGTERGQSTEESKRTSTQHAHKPGTCIIPGTTTTTTAAATATAVCPKERTAPHDTALQNEGQGTPPHCAALRC